MQESIANRFQFELLLRTQYLPVQLGWLWPFRFPKTNLIQKSDQWWNHRDSFSTCWWWGRQRGLSLELAQLSSSERVRPSSWGAPFELASSGFSLGLPSSRGWPPLVLVHQKAYHRHQVPKETKFCWKGLHSAMRLPRQLQLIVINNLISMSERNI